MRIRGGKSRAAGWCCGKGAECDVAPHVIAVPHCTIGEARCTVAVASCTVNSATRKVDVAFRAVDSAGCMGHFARAARGVARLAADVARAAAHVAYVAANVARPSNFRDGMDGCGGYSAGSPWPSNRASLECPTLRPYE